MERDLSSTRCCCCCYYYYHHHHHHHSASRNRKDLLAPRYVSVGRPRCTYFRVAFNRDCICSDANYIAIPSLEVSNKQIPTSRFSLRIARDLKINNTFVFFVAALYCTKTFYPAFAKHQTYLHRKKN